MRRAWVLAGLLSFASCGQIFGRFVEFDATCADGIQNGSEVDVDCGGTTCARCVDGNSCGSGPDCTSSVCAAGRCLAPSCTDSAKNASETDADCGGPACGPCADGRSCDSGTDCVSTMCMSGTCAAPSCIDSIKNAAETDKDCGGPMCAPCAEGRTCVLPSDCASGTCEQGLCVPVLPPNMVPEASNLVLWLDGEKGWNGTNWLDQSGGGRHANAYFTPVSTGRLNGKSVVDFLGGSLLIRTGFPNWGGLTVFAVANTASDDAIFSLGTSFNTNCVNFPQAGAPGCVPYDQLAFNGGMSLQQCDPAIGTCWQAGFDRPVPLGTWVRLTGWEQPGATPAYRSYYNGKENANLTRNLGLPYPAPWNTPRVDSIVGWRNYRGLVAEIIVFNMGISDRSRVAIDRYLAAKWNVR